MSLLNLSFVTAAKRGWIEASVVVLQLLLQCVRILPAVSIHLSGQHPIRQVHELESST